jgi:hypothetical protein
MKKQFIWLCGAVMFSILLCINASGLVTHDETLDKMQREVVLINLINGLYLTPDQIDKIELKNKEAQKVRDRFVKQINKERKEMVKILDDLKEVLLESQNISKDLKKQVRKIKEIQFKLQEERGEQLLRLESEIQDILTENQIMVIDTYKPCLVPPEKGKIGQSIEAGAERIVRMLKRIRQMPRENYELMKEMMIDLYIDKVEHHVGILTPEERTQLQEDALIIFENVRSMSDEEFFIKKGELAKDFIHEKDSKPRQRKYSFGRVGNFLLDPLIVPLLRLK